MRKRIIHPLTDEKLERIRLDNLYMKDVQRLIDEIKRLKESLKVYEET